MSGRPLATGLRLSIVIPARDTCDLTLRCLESLQSALPAGAEVLLVDDGSGDGTAEEVARRFPAVRLLRFPTSEGFTRAANRGLAEARGDVMLLLNSDTEVEPAALHALRARFAAAPAVGVGGAALHYPDGTPQWSGGAEPSLAWLFALASGWPLLLARLPLYRRLRPLAPAAEPRRVGWVTGAALAIRRTAWEEVGPLDERFRFYAQDLDFCVRARAAGWEIEIMPQVRVLHHHGATIGRTAGAVGSLGRQHPELLWTDLLRWARKRRGPRWAAWAAGALRCGGVLRLIGLRAAYPFVRGVHRDAWRVRARSLAAALQAVGREGEV